MKNKIFFFLFTLLVSIAALWPSVVRADNAPMWLCAGVEPWVFSSPSDLSDAAPCGSNTGTYLVDKDTGTFSYWDWYGVKNYSGEGAGTIWYQPELFLRPVFFCDGSDAWPLPLNAVVPEDPVCPDGSGEYILDLDYGQARVGTWGEARDALWGHEGTVYFERTVQPIADGFCDGGVPWQVPGNSLFQEEMVCPENSGIYFADTENGLDSTPYWDSARGMIGDNGGTFWYEKTPELVMRDPPDGFCQGGVVWPVPPFSMLPDSAVCDGTGGNYVSDYSAGLERSDSWSYIKSVMENNEGSIWFEPFI